MRCLAGYSYCALTVELPSIWLLQLDAILVRWTAKNSDLNDLKDLPHSSTLAYI